MKYRTILFFWIFLTGVLPLSGQSLVSPQQMGFAGGGSLILNGPLSNYVNPASVMINDYRTGNTVVLGNIGVQSPLLSLHVPNSNTLSTIESPFYASLNTTRTSFEENVGTQAFTKRQSGTHAFSSSILSLSIRRKSSAFSFSTRSRLINDFNVSEGWNTPLSLENSGRSFQQSTIALHEITLGFSREIDYLNGLNRSLRSFFVGFAPSVILPSSYSSTDYSQSFVDDSRKQTSFRATSSGQFSRYLEEIRLGSSSPESQLSQDDYFSFDGWGLGFNGGLALVIPLGSDIALANPDEQSLRKSMRFGISLLDAGFFTLSNEVSTYTTVSDTSIISSPETGFSPLWAGEVSSSELTTTLSEPIQESILESSSTQRVMLPTRIQASWVFQWNWFYLSTDALLRLNKQFARTQSYLGFIVSTEIHFLPFLPIRGGVRLNRFQPALMGVGTSLELKRFVFDIGIQSDIENSTLLGYGFGYSSAIRIRF